MKPTRGFAPLAPWVPAQAPIAPGALSPAQTAALAATRHAATVAGCAAPLAIVACLPWLWPVMPEVMLASALACVESAGVGAGSVIDAVEHRRGR